MSCILNFVKLLKLQINFFNFSLILTKSTHVFLLYNRATWLLHFLFLKQSLKVFIEGIFSFHRRNFLFFFLLWLKNFVIFIFHGILRICVVFWIIVPIVIVYFELNFIVKFVTLNEIILQVFIENKILAENFVFASYKGHWKKIVFGHLFLILEPKS